MLLHCKRIAELCRPIVFFFICKFSQKRKPHLCRTPLPWVGCNHPPWDVLLRHEQPGITPEHFSAKGFLKMWNRGWLPCFVFLKMVSDVHCAFQTSSLLCCCISFLIIPRSSVIIINTFNAFLTRNRGSLPASGNQQCLGPCQVTSAQTRSNTVTTFSSVWRKSQRYFSLYLSLKHTDTYMCIHIYM